MSFDFKLPNITATSDAGKVEQIRGYLYQLTEQLKWALNSIESGNGGYVVQKGNQSVTKSISKDEAKATFESIKALIISSAEVVNSYYERFNERFSGEYVAQSDFGTYKEETAQEIIKTSTEIESFYTNIQEIINSNIENLEHKIIETNAHIKSGLLDYNENEEPIYGLEIGQKNKIDGEEVFNKYARFTADRLSFYDKNDTEVAYISDYKLYITIAEIGTLIIGRYVFDSSNGLVVKWV